MAGANSTGNISTPYWMEYYSIAELPKYIVQNKKENSCLIKCTPDLSGWKAE